MLDISAFKKNRCEVIYIYFTGRVSFSQKTRQKENISGRRLWYETLKYIAIVPHISFLQSLIVFRLTKYNKKKAYN